MRLGGADVIFSPGNQRLLQIDDPAALKALSSLKDGTDIRQFQPELSPWLVQWSRAGLICADPAEEPFERESRVDLGANTFVIQGGPDNLLNACLAPYHLAENASSGSLTTRVTVRGHGAITAIGTAGQPAHLTFAENAVCDLRNHILGLILARIQGPALHCAALRSATGTVLLVGEPGAGKSTLTLALMQQGWSVAGDDVTLISGNGEASGVPLPLTIKQPAWSLIETWMPETADLPAQERADGATLKYLPIPPDKTANGAAKVQAIIKLARNPDLTVAQPNLTHWDKIAAMTDLFAEGHHPSGVADADMVAAMIALVEGAQCRTLSYAEAEEAATLLAETYG